MKGKVEINGKEYPCRVTMGALVRFKNETGKDVSEMKQTDLKEMCLFLWCCVKSACNADKVPFEMDFLTFADNLDAGSMQAFYKDMETDGKNAVSPMAEK